MPPSVVFSGKLIECLDWICKAHHFTEEYFLCPFTHILIHLIWGLFYCFLYTMFTCGSFRIFAGMILVCRFYAHVCLGAGFKLYGCKVFLSLMYCCVHCAFTGSCGVKMQLLQFQDTINDLTSLKRLMLIRLLENMTIPPLMSRLIFMLARV